MSYNSYFDNRELSWLKFNKRVLQEAQDRNVPLFERLRFISIFCNNLDEFFMIRVGSLRDQTLLKNEKTDNKTNLTANEQLELIAEDVRKLIVEKDNAYFDIMSKLHRCGIVQVSAKSATESDLVYLKSYFVKEILPLLSPSIIDKKHPIPFLKNKELYIGAELKRHESDKKAVSVGIIPASGVFSRVIYMPENEHESNLSVKFMLVEELILCFASLIFTNYDILDADIFRITRNADIDVNEALYDHDLDFRDVMEEVVKKRRKLAPVRMEFMRGSDETADAIFGDKLKLAIGKNYIFAQNTPLDLGFVSEIESQLSSKKELFFEPFTPQKNAYIDEKEPLIKQIKAGDILLSYPFEAFKPFIMLLEEAATDPHVVSIKITLYRVARDSKIVNALIKAVENGKEVLALVELRARFDEENNIGWSIALEEAGVHVIYGLDELKVHSKLLLITRKIGTNIEYITQVGTGNYNERTSKLYTDLTLLTADPAFGTDASLVFNALSVGATVESSTTLLVAPNCLKSHVVALIDNEATYGSDGYIGIKLNSLSDKDIIDKLVEASQKGVTVELIVRGICCLIAGIPGVTDNITVTSIVGRFLEHSRIYIFGRAERQRVYISSADFMTRNTERRVEVAAPIKSKAIRKRIVDSFNCMLRDNVKARIQLSDGSYKRKERLSEDEPLDVQMFFCKEAYARAEKAAAGRDNKLKAMIHKVIHPKKAD